jgi:phospholipid-binding lipoprotein MlaA
LRRILTPAVLAILVMLPAQGLARPQPSAGGHTPGDPWEKTNRRIFALNQALDRAFIKPLSKVTSGLTPGPLGQAIHNFLVNLNEPVVIVNDLLQIRPGPAVRSAFRLVVNTTAGGLGAIDVAKGLGDPAHVNGFGDTLGRWGVHPGPYLVVPVLGPSDVRDLFGSVVDDATLPFQSIDYPYRTEVDITVALVGGLNERERVGRDYEALLADATDPYATLRSAYLQSREAQVRGEKALPVLPDIEETPSPATPPAAGEQPALPDIPSEPTPATPQPAAPAAGATPQGAPSLATPPLPDIPSEPAPQTPTPQPPASQTTTPQASLPADGPLGLSGALVGLNDTPP